MFKSLRKRKPIVYISLGIYVFLLSLILVESSLPGGLSGTQSNIFATISAWIVNIMNGPRVPTSISPTGFKEVTDSSFLGKDEEGYSNIAIGTTSLISIPVTYPKKENNYDVYNKEYTLSYPKGNRDDYSVVISSRTNKEDFIIYLRVVAKEVIGDDYEIDVTVGDTITYKYHFNIVPLVTPVDYESYIEKTNLKIGETTKVITKLTNNDRTDSYLRRYFDERRIERHSSNDEIVRIDEYGVVHALKEGEATITYGKYTYDIVVSSDSIIKPVSNSISLTIDETSKDNPSLLDYDYVFEKSEEPNFYSTLIKATFSDSSLEDKSVSFYPLTDSLKVKLAPHHYSVDGYPIYLDEDGNNYLRVCGYREKGEVTIRCVSNADNNIYQDIILNVNEAIPTEMKLNIGEKNQPYVNDQITISATFSPKNVNNRNIHIEVTNKDILSIKNNDSSSVIITGTSIGKTKVTVSSILNPSLTKEIEIEWIARQAIDDDNFNDFAGFLRKAAGHFMLFLVTAIFGIIFFYFYFDDIKVWWLMLSMSLGTGLLVAGLSELIQKFTDGRSGLWSDVGIDFLGYFIGTVLTIGIIFLIRLIKSKRKPEEEK